MSWVRHHDRYQNSRADYTPPWEAVAAAKCKHCEAEAHT